MRRVVLVLGAALLLAACGPAAPPPTAAPVYLTLAGPADLEPVGQALARGYMALRPYATVTYQAGDWESGLRAVAQREAQVGLWTGMATNGVVDLGADLTTTLVARDAVAVVVAPHNPVVSLRLLDMQTMFAGRISNWQVVGGDDRPVQVLCWYDGARLRGFFDGLVMRGRPVTPTALVVSSDAGVEGLIAERPNAIGYMRWQALSPQVRALAVDGVQPDSAQVGSGRYPLSLPVMLVTATRPNADVRDLVRFVQSPEGQAIMARWFAPLP
ncbi:MAG: substrate-binding domain-containing protein [Chloroflexi bacterium]|nr:substrate-binding domain-containing protein [Chloroflexota bacterium]MBU1749819.1 substrate-binding domain-containing protein [Chloroflexota bacterium]